ncbi:MAG: MFS transporter [Oscillospiraceae bacterium]
MGATAPNMLVLVVSRALYGLGYGFINAAVMIMINELFGKKSGYGYLITLIGYGVGNVGVPLLAGWLVENYTWRWGFWLLVASAVVCIALLVSSCPNYTMLQESNSKKLDVKGIIYSVLAISGLVGVLSFGGKSFAWLSLGPRWFWFCLR